MSLAHTKKSDIVKSIEDVLLYDNMVNRKINPTKKIIIIDALIVDVLKK